MAEYPGAIFRSGLTGHRRRGPDLAFCPVESRLAWLAGPPLGMQAPGLTRWGCMNGRWLGASRSDYHVVMSKRTATPVRFDPSVADRLASFVAANPGMSLSSAANRLVDEALRMAEHPGVVFRPGPTGRRAALAGGPDVWEVVRAVRSARAAEPELADDGLLGLVAGNTGTP